MCGVAGGGVPRVGPSAEAGDPVAADAVAQPRTTRRILSPGRGRRHQVRAPVPGVACSPLHVAFWTWSQHPGRLEATEDQRWVFGPDPKQIPFFLIQFPRLVP